MNEKNGKQKVCAHIYFPPPSDPLSYAQPRSLKCTRGTVVRGYLTHYLAPTDRQAARPNSTSASLFVTSLPTGQGVGVGVSATTIVEEAGGTSFVATFGVGLGGSACLGAGRLTN